jgi:fatty-acyl-CoA synthase
LLGTGSSAAHAAVDIGAGAASTSWADLHRAATTLAGALRRSGLDHGDVVVAAGMSSEECVLLVFATWRCGAAVSLVAWTGVSGARNVAGRVHSTRARIVFAPATLRDELRAQLPNQVAVLDEATIRGHCSHGAPRSESDERLVSWPPADAVVDDVAILQATSGTTGSHRLVPVTWRMLLANLRAITDRLGLSETDRFTSWMPLYHDMGLIGFVALPAYLGARMTLVRTDTFARSPGSFIEALATTRATMSGTTTFGLAITERALRRHRSHVDLSALRRLVCGAELIDLDVCDRFVEAGAPHGLRRDVFAFAYGMAESTLAISIRRPSTAAAASDRSLSITTQHRRGSVWERTGAHGFARTGPPVDGIEVRAVDTAGRSPCRDAEVGEVEVRGASVFGGYVGLQADESGLDSDGWFRTGDLGYLVDGEVVIVGRTKDVLVVGGRNVVPDDVERVVEDLPGIRRVAAVPVRGAAGEGFAILAESRRGSPTTQHDVRAALRRAVDLSPDLVLFVAAGELPRTTSGKLRRSACLALLPHRQSPTTHHDKPVGKEQVTP